MPYIPFTEEEKMTANSVDLADFLRVRGEKLERAGREFKLIYSDDSGSHDSITIRGSTWFDHKNQTGGGAIKFMQYHYGMDFPTAVQELLGQRVRTCSHRLLHISFWQIRLITALKIFAIRQYACKFLPCSQPNYAQKSMHKSYENKF